MKWYRNMKLGAKLLSVMLLVSLLPLTAVGVTAFLQARNALQEAAYTSQDIYAEQKATIIEDWFHELATHAEIAAATRSTYQSQIGRAHV